MEFNLAPLGNATQSTTIRGSKAARATSTSGWTAHVTSSSCVRTGSQMEAMVAATAMKPE